MTKNTNIKKHLFLFTIGPVQSFIAQARKTQDMYSASKILSKLLQAAIDAVGAQKVVFPYMEPNNQNDSLPNRLIAIVDECDFNALGITVEKKVRARWLQIATQAMTSQCLNLNKFSIDQGVFEQINKHLEIYWLFEPINNDYKNAYELIERKLGAIKNVRAFEQFSYKGIGEKGRKCSLDGFRNVKYYRKSEKQSGTDSEIQTLFATDNCVIGYNERNFPIGLLAPGEGLSAVSFVKRAYQYDKLNFESTAEIALFDTLDYLKSNYNDALQNYKELFGDNFNPQFYFEESLNDEYLKRQGIEQPDLNPAKTIRKELEDLAKTNHFKFKKYYAILVFDGDNMGKWLSGDNEVIILNQPNELEQFQKDFSKQLSLFAEQAKDSVDTNKWGRTVYAGGDDYLGFFNLEHLLTGLHELRQLFRKTVNSVLKDKYTLKNEITFSAGICIAHYKEPLSLVLNRARSVEKKAKDWRDKKDAYGIAVIKGSGEEHETFWGFENDSLMSIQYLIDKMRDETFSNTFLKNFQREFTSLLNLDSDLTENDIMLKTELGRLLYRSTNSKHDKPKRLLIKDEILEKIWTNLFSNQLETTFPNFFSMLNISDFMQRTLNPTILCNTKVEENANN